MSIFFLKTKSCLKNRTKTAAPPPMVKGGVQRSLKTEYITNHVFLNNLLKNLFCVWHLLCNMVNLNLKIEVKKNASPTSSHFSTLGKKFALLIFLYRVGKRRRIWSDQERSSPHDFGVDFTSWDFIDTLSGCDLIRPSTISFSLFPIRKVQEDPHRVFLEIHPRTAK